MRLYHNRATSFALFLLILGVLLFGQGNSLAQTPSPVQAIAWHPDGNQLAIVTLTNEVWLYSDTLQAIVQIPVESGPGNERVAWSPDGTMLAISSHSGGRNSWILIWDVTTRSQVARFEQNQPDVSNLAWNPDSHYLATEEINRVKIWDVTSESLLATIEAHELPGSVEEISWSPDGSGLASTGGDLTARIWDASTYEPVAILPLTDITNDIIWSPDGDQLAVVNYADVYVWETVDYQQIATLDSGFTHSILSLDWQTNRLIASGSDGYARLWDTDTWEVIQDIPFSTIGGTFRAVALNPDGTSLAYVNKDGELENIPILD